MNTINDRRGIRMLCAVCCAVYFTSYLTRLDYAALLNQTVVLGHLSRTAAAAVSTGAFVTYGIGQAVCGITGDRADPRKMVAAGLSLSAVCNILMFFFSGSGAVCVTVIWCVNGFCQSMIWPPLVRTAAVLLDRKDYSRTINLVLYSDAAGTVFVYVLAAALIKYSAWRYTYIICAAVGVTVAVLWLSVLYRIPQSRAFSRREKSGCSKATETNEQSGSNDGGEPQKKTAAFPKTAALFFIPVAFAVIMQGILRDGVTTWMPSFMTEVSGLDTSSSAISAIIMPVFAVLGVIVAAFLMKRTHNELKGCAILFFSSGVMCLVLIMVFGQSAAVSALLMAGITGCMHSINALLISYFPARFIASGRVSTVTGTLNACSYVGSALSVYGVALLSQLFGWKSTVIIWAAITLLGLLFSLFAFMTKRKVLGES